MFETLFGSEMPLAARFVIAFLVVLALIGVTAWLVRRFGASRLGGGAARGRQPRLAGIDAATVDGRRRLLLIRRDNVEHLLMIGGPTDVVVEQNIVRAAGARDMARPGMAEPAARGAPSAETAWPLQPINEPPAVAPVASPPPRGYRAPATDEPWLPPEPGARPRPTDSLTGMASEFSTRVSASDFAAAPVRHEPPPMAPPAASVPTATQTDQNLAEMAQQLEAALRRAPAPENRPPVTDPLAMQAAKPVEPPRAPPRDFKPRVEPKIEQKIEQKIEPKAEPKFEPKFESKPRFEPKVEPKPESKPEPKAETPKFEPVKTETVKAEPAPVSTTYDNLEEEMASLLGRPPGKT
jgi:hypothetical protein